MARIKKYINEYYVQTGREPSAEEIAENTNVRLNKVMDLLVLLRGFASLNEMSVDSEDFDVELMDTLQDPTDGIQDADDCMMVEQILHDLDEILTPKDKELVLGALGFYGDDHATTVYQQACCSPQIRADYKRQLTVSGVTIMSRRTKDTHGHLRTKRKKHDTTYRSIMWLPAVT